MDLFKVTQKQPKYFDVLIGMSVAVLIISNITSVKIVSIGPLVFDAGTILFPVAYILGDIITEIYGYNRARRAIFIGLLAMIIMSITLMIVQYLPAEASWGNQAAYATILGVVPRIAVASIIAYTIGELLNSYVLASLKIRTKGKKLWNRLIGSSLIGSFVDTITFSVIAFAGLIPTSALLQLVVTVFIMKIAFEIIVSPSL